MCMCIFFMLQYMRTSHRYCPTLKSHQYKNQHGIWLPQCLLQKIGSSHYVQWISSTDTPHVNTDDDVLPKWQARQVCDRKTHICSSFNNKIQCSTWIPPFWPYTHLWNFKDQTDGSETKGANWLMIRYKDILFCLIVKPCTHRPLCLSTNSIQ